MNSRTHDNDIYRTFLTINPGPTRLLRRLSEPDPNPVSKSKNRVRTRSFIQKPCRTRVVLSDRPDRFPTLGCWKWQILVLTLHLQKKRQTAWIFTGSRMIYIQYASCERNHERFYRLKAILWLIITQWLFKILIRWRQFWKANKIRLNFHSSEFWLTSWLLSYLILNFWTVDERNF